MGGGRQLRRKDCALSCTVINTVVEKESKEVPEL